MRIGDDFVENNDIVNAHVCSSYNRKQLSKVDLCGCFYCLKKFNPKLIVEWCDNGETAICPFCGIDSILYDCKTYPVTDKLLEEMNKYWF